MSYELSGHLTVAPAYFFFFKSKATQAWSTSSGVSAALDKDECHPQGSEREKEKGAKQRLIIGKGTAWMAACQSSACESAREKDVWLGEQWG